MTPADRKAISKRQVKRREVMSVFSSVAMDGVSRIQTLPSWHVNECMDDVDTLLAHCKALETGIKQAANDLVDIVGDTDRITPAVMQDQFEEVASDLYALLKEVGHE